MQHHGGAGQQPVYDRTAAWTTVAILFLLVLLSFVDRQIISMLVGPIKHSLGLTDTQFSIGQGLAFAIFFSIGGIPLGLAIDRLSRRHVLFYCILVWAIGCAGCGVATSLSGLFVARALVGSGEAALTPAAASLIGDNFPQETAGVAYGVFGAGNYVGYGVSLGLGGALITVLSAGGVRHLPVLGAIQPWQAAFLIAGLPGLLLAFLAFAIHDVRPARHAESGTLAGAHTMGRLFLERGRPMLHFLIGISALTAAFQVVSAWSPAFFSRRYGLTAAEIGTKLGIGIGLFGGLGSLLGGLAIDRLRRAGVEAAPFVIAIGAAVTAAPLIVGAHLAANSTTAFMLLSAGLLLFGSIAAASYASIQAIAPPNDRGKLAALVVIVCAIVAQGIAPVAVALVTDFVFHSEARIGSSLAIVIGAFSTIGAISFASGVRPLRRVAN